MGTLKTLNLTLVYFQSFNDYIYFLSACPNLEDFHAKCIYCKKHDENNAPEEEEWFKSFTLSKLVRASIGSMHVMFNVFKNVKFLVVLTVYMEKYSFKLILVFQNVESLVLAVFLVK
jgi:hypothetical protein